MTQLLLRSFHALNSGWGEISVGNLCVFTARFEQYNTESSILITKFENLIVNWITFGYWYASGIYLISSVKAKKLDVVHTTLAPISEEA